MTTHWWIANERNGHRVAEGVIDVGKLPAGPGGAKMRKDADDLAAEIAGTVAALMGLEPTSVCWIKRAGGTLYYQVIKRTAGNARGHKWRQSDIYIR